MPTDRRIQVEGFFDAATGTVSYLDGPERVSRLQKAPLTDNPRAIEELWRPIEHRKDREPE